MHFLQIIAKDGLKVIWNAFWLGSVTWPASFDHRDTDIKDTDRLSMDGSEAVGALKCVNQKNVVSAD